MENQIVKNNSSLGTEVLEAEKEEKNAENDKDGWEDADSKWIWIDMHHSSNEEQQEIAKKLNSLMEEPECPVTKYVSVPSRKSSQHCKINF